MHITITSNPKSTVRFILACTLLSLAASSCRHTVQGFGRDMERVGDRIENTAR